MSINFPNSPSNGQTHTSGGKTYVYNSSKTSWLANAIPPFDSAVIANIKTQNTLDSAGINTVISSSSDVFDSSQVISLVSTNSNKVFTVANLAALGALSGMSTGDQAIVTATNKLYMYNGTGWFLIATITNGSPSAITGVDSNYALATDGTAIVINAIATDPEGETLTWSSSTSGLTNEATVTQGTGDSSNYFTVTPSTTPAHAGTFTLTLGVTDGVNGAVNFPIGFTLSFPSPWAGATQHFREEGGSGDRLGYSMDLDRSTHELVVGVPYAGADGRAYRYTFNTSTSVWSGPMNSYAPSDTAATHAMGFSVAIRDGAVVAGSSGLNVGSTAAAGAVYAFSGSQKQKIVRSTPAAYDQFGRNIMMQKVGSTGRLIFVACQGKNEGNQGSVEIYYTSNHATANSYSRTTSMQSPDSSWQGGNGYSSEFGNTLAGAGFGTSNQYFLIGDGGYNSGSGKVYLYKGTGTTGFAPTTSGGAALVEFEAPTGAEGLGVWSYFGNGISMSGDTTTIAIGQPGGHITALGSPYDSGHVYIYTGSGSSWSLQAKLTPSDSILNQRFGHSVNLSDDGNTIAIGSNQAAAGSATDSGAIYIFERSGSTWSQSARFNHTPSDNTPASDGYGKSVALTADAYKAVVSSAPGAVGLSGGIVGFKYT